MSYSRPNFVGRQGSQITRPVAQRFESAAVRLSRFSSHADRIEWLSQLQRTDLSSLVSLTAATLFSANRWTYTGAIFHPAPLAGGGVTVPADATFSYSGIVNLAEWFNTSVLVDGQNVTAPPVVVGPVGSVFVSGAWSTSELSRIIQLFVYTDRAGGAFPIFDAPNPVRCTI